MRADVLLAREAPRLAPAFALGDEPYTLIAAGKAAHPMADAWLRLCRGPCRAALVVSNETPRAEPAHLVEAIAAGHPVPTRGSVVAGERALALATTLGAHDRLVVLLSGGASSLLARPAPGISLEDKVAATGLLLRGGAAIDDLNAVRKHLSSIKGGHLAAATQAETLTLALSDVVGPIEDDPSVVGSGPTVADPTTYEAALRVLERCGAIGRVPSAARRHLEAGAAGRAVETPKPGDPRLARSGWRLVGGRRDAMSAAAAIADARGYDAVVIDEPVVGEARIAGPALVEHARSRAAGRRRPCCVIASGETTVRVTGTGRGGRNQELVLGAVPALADWAEAVTMASVGTDGRDGPTDAAGAVADASTAMRARRAGLAPVIDWLADNNAYAFFDALGDLVRTGPTGTNVADLQVLLIG